jgi:hypothetical protein
MRRLLCVVPVLALIALAAPASGRAAGVEVLTQTEQESALKYGQQEGTVSSLEAMHSSSAVEAAEQITGRKQPAEAVGPKAPAMTSTPVDVVVLHGQFVAWDTPAPRGQPTQEGTVLELVMNPLTGQVAASSLGDTPTVSSGNAAVERESIKPSSVQVAHLLQLRADARRAVAGAHVRHGRARAATWDGKCHASENTHCYAVAEWYMKPAGERIIGSHYLLNMDAESYATPGGEQFIDDEEWMRPGPDGESGETQESWAESGIIKRYGEHQWWFFAFKYKKNEKLAFYMGAPYTTEVTEGEWDRQGLISRGNGEYCVVIGWEYQDVWYCGYVGFIYSKLVEDGAEMADESTPLDRSGAESNYEGLEGKYWNWNKAEYAEEDHAGEHVGSPVCVTPWTGSSPAGDIYDGTYC